MGNHTPSDLPARMTAKVRVDANGCWEWLGYVQSNGYGKVSYEGKARLAHRVSYMILVGHIPDSLVLDHICRNRHCCNPDHLRAVTQRDNALAPGSESVPAVNKAKTHCPQGHHLDVLKSDNSRTCSECAIVRDRARWPQRSEERRLRRFAVTGGRRPRGETHPNAKLTDLDVEQLRQLHLDGVSGVDLARMFGISKGQVSRIANGTRRALPARDVA